VHWYVRACAPPKPDLIREIKLRGLRSVSAVFAALANAREDAPSKIGLASLLKTLWARSTTTSRDAPLHQRPRARHIQKDGTSASCRASTAESPRRPS